MATVTQEQCDERNANLHKRVNTLCDKVSRIIGGVIVISSISILVITGTMYHLNYRFNNIEKKNEKMELNIEKGFNKLERQIQNIKK